jgi:hypothetical protein
MFVTDPTGFAVHEVVLRDVSISPDEIVGWTAELAATSFVSAKTMEEGPLVEYALCDNSEPEDEEAHRAAWAVG